MKKLLIMASAALLFASCGSDTYEEWAQPQTYGADSATTVKFAATAAPEIDFEKVTTDSVVLFTPTLTSEDAVKAQTLTVTLFNEKKTANYVLNADAKGQVKASELQAAVESLYGKAGVLRSIAATVANKVVLEKGEGFLLSSDMTSLVKLVKPDFEEFIYEIGNDSGWGTVQYVRSPEMDGNYTGYCYLNGEFKFRSHVDSWDAPDWEYGGTEGSLSENGKSNFADPGKGFYKVEASLANGTLKLTKIDVISIIGSVLDANWRIDGDMTFNESEKAWTWSGHLDAGEMKFRVNHDWAISWGGANGDAKAYGNLTEKDGKNLVVDEAGEYTVKLFITYEGNNRVELTKN